MQQQGQPRLVAGGQEARQQRFGHQRVAHIDVGRGGAETGAGPGNGHQPHLAVEVGHVERELHLSVGAGLNRRDEQGHRLLRNVRQHEAALVAALAQHGRRAVGRCDQPAPVVADVEPETAAAEEMIGRVGRGEVGQPQDAFVHRREADPGAGRRMQPDRGAGARRVLVGHVERHRQLARARIYADPGQADGATGARFRVRRRAEHVHCDIGAGTPVGGDRHVDIGATGRD